MRCLGAFCLLAAGCFSKPERPVGDGDAAVDSPPGTGSRLRAFSKANNASSTVTYSLQFDGGENTLLLVTAVLGMSCNEVPPNVISVTAEGMPMSRFTQISGSVTTCPAGAESELWTMVAPPTGLLSITITLDATAKSLHSGAFAFDGVDQATPIRTMAVGKGEGVSSGVTVDGEPGDLVVDFVGQGGLITAPGPGQVTTFIANHGAGTTLDNTGSSTIIADNLTTMTWEFGQIDQWEMIAVALTPK